MCYKIRNSLAASVLGKNSPAETTGAIFKGVLSVCPSVTRWHRVKTSGRKLSHFKDNIIHGFYALNMEENRDINYSSMEKLQFVIKLPLHFVIVCGRQCY